MRLRSMVLFGGTLAVLVGGVVVGVQAKAAAGRVQNDMEAAKGLLAQAGDPEIGKLGARLALVDQAAGRVRSARRRLAGWPLRPLAALPLVGRDLRVADTVAGAAEDTVGVTRAVVTGLAPLERGTLDARSLRTASAALARLAGTLRDGETEVRAAQPFLLTRNARAEFLRTGGEAARTADAASEGLRLAAALYGPAGSARWFVGFQNPAELRGTGGLLGQYGILESGPGGPKLVHVGGWEELDGRTRRRVRLASGLARRYGRFGLGGTWTAVNIPPDLPTVSRILTEQYRLATGQRIDGVVMVDPLAVAEILQVHGPVDVDGVRLTAANVADQTLVQAYIRYETDNEGRRRFLQQVAQATWSAAHETLATKPLDLLHGLADAAHGRHIQLWTSDARAEQALLGLGIGGSAKAPASGDYLMAVGVNAAGNKIDAFLHRRLAWDVRLAADGAASARASLTLRNAVPRLTLPQYIVGPYDRRFRVGEQRQFQSLYLADGYGFTSATQDGRAVAAESQPEQGATVLSRYVSVAPKRAVALGFDLERQGAAELVGGQLHYRLLVRPQAVVNADQLDLAVTAPAGWRFTTVPPGFRVGGQTAAWAGSLVGEQTLDFWMAPPA